MPIGIQASWTRILETTESPYDGVVKLQVKWENNDETGCSGSLYDNNSIVTAAHCLYNPIDKIQATKVSVIPGKNGTNEPFGKLDAIEIAVSTQWMELSEKNLIGLQYDYGVVNVPSTLGWPLNTKFGGDSYVGYIKSSENQEAEKWIQKEFKKYPDGKVTYLKMESQELNLISTPEKEKK